MKLKYNYYNVRNDSENVVCKMTAILFRLSVLIY